jgi:GT2 family glycosyltransferase
MKSDNADTLAVVLSWNELELTLRCLESLAKQTRPGLDIVVVDNGSSVDPTAAIGAMYPSVRVLRSPVNLGVSKGRNLAFRVAASEGYRYVLAVDNDIEASPTMFAELYRRIETTAAAGIVGPKIYRDDTRDVLYRAGCTSIEWTYIHPLSDILDTLWRTMGWGARLVFDVKRGSDQRDVGQYDRAEEVEFPHPPMLIRTEVFRQIGLFDPEFDPYGAEDLDFSIRASRAGWSLWYEPRAICWHRSGSSFNDGYLRAYQNTRNIFLLARRHVSGAKLAAVVLPEFVLISTGMKLLDATLRRQPKRARGVIDAARWHLEDIRKRGLRAPINPPRV